MDNSTRPETAASPARSIDRRQLLRAGAWAALVVLVATAVPAASASGGSAGWSRNPLSVNANRRGQSGPPNNTQYFTEIYGSGYPEIAYANNPVVTVTHMYVSITVPSANMTRAAGTITGTGWSVNGTGFTINSAANTITYKFKWSGSIVSNGSRQFAFNFVLPGDGTSTMAAVGAKPLTFCSPPRI